MLLLKDFNMESNSERNVLNCYPIYKTSNEAQRAVVNVKYLYWVITFTIKHKFFEKIYADETITG